MKKAVVEVTFYDGFNPIRKQYFVDELAYREYEFDFFVEAEFANVQRFVHDWFSSYQRSNFYNLFKKYFFGSLYVMPPK